MPDADRTYQDLLRAGTLRLRDAGIETARLDAEVLLRHVTELDRAGLFLRLPEPVPGGLESRFNALTARRLHGEPVAYIVGRREFMGLPIRVAPGVLIPRPETELLVEWSIGFLKAKSEGQRRLVVDVGAGAGGIALSIADAFRESQVHVVGCDISRPAVQWAERNRQQLGLAHRVDLVLGDLVCWLGSPATLILANLPYLRADQLRGNWELSMEPEIALVSGDDGLDAIRRLLADCSRVLAADGAVAIEIDPSQSAAVSYLMKQALPQLTIHVLHDLAGHERFVIGSVS